MSVPRRRVTPEEIRARFNALELVSDVEAGRLIAVLERQSLARSQSGQPSGTVSRMVWYLDHDMTRIALVHEYRLPDGSVGGSGRPDPKRLLVDGEILYC